MKLRMVLAAAFLSLIAIPTGAAAQGRPQSPPQVLTYEMAKDAAEAAEAYARGNGWNVIVIVVDAQGVPIYLKRLDNAIPGAYDYATGKLRTVIGSGLSTKEYAERLAAGTIEAVPDAVALEGAFPIMKDGELVGAIAVSGVRPQQDAMAAQAGLDAISGL